MRYAGWITLWWTVYGVANAVRYREIPGPGGAPVGWLGALPAELAGALLWIPSTLVVIVLVERFPFGGRAGSSTGRALLAHLGGLAATVLTPRTTTYVSISTGRRICSGPR